MSVILFKNDTANIKSATQLFGVHTVTSAEATANTLSIDLSSDLAVIDGAIVQIKDSGNNILTADADVTFSGATLTIADGSTLNLAAGYIVSYLAVGSLSN